MWKPSLLVMFLHLSVFRLGQGALSPDSNAPSIPSSSYSTSKALAKEQPWLPFTSATRQKQKSPLHTQCPLRGSWGSVFWVWQINLGYHPSLGLDFTDGRDLRSIPILHMSMLRLSEVTLQPQDHLRMEREAEIRMLVSGLCSPVPLSSRHFEI